MNPMKASELMQIARQRGVSVHSLLNISIPEDPIKEFLAGNITEGCLMEYLGVDRLEARRLVQEKVVLGDIKPDPSL